MRLANKLAGNTAHFNKSNQLLSHEDLLQEAIIGLDYAVTSFNPDMGTRFSTYAVYWIRSYLQNYTHKNSFSVHVAATSDIRLLVKRLRVIREKLLKKDPNLQYNSQMLCQKIAEETNITLDLVTKVYQLISQNPLELNKRSLYFDDAEGNELDLRDESDTFGSVDYGIDMERFREIIQNFLKTLPDRDKFVIEKRYFVEDNDDVWTLEMLGEKYSLSRERVRQIESRVLKELRSLINGNVVRSRIKTKDKSAPKIHKIDKFQF
jgi:RNA polymerase sigma-32 factor